MTKYTKKEVFHQQVFFFATLSFIVSLPFSILFNNVSIILLLINWLAQGQWKYKLNSLKHPIVYSFMGVYLLYILSFFFSQNQTEAGFKLEQHLSLCMLPWLIASSPQITSKKINSLFVVFIITQTIAMLICISMAIFSYYTDKQDIVKFFYHQLSYNIDLHAVYFSFYLCLSVFFILYLSAQVYHKLSVIKKLLLILLFGFHLIFIVLLSSKTIIFALLVTLFFTFIFAGGFIIQSLVIRLILASVMVCSTVIGIMSVPMIKNRFTEAINSQFDFIEKKEYGELTRWTGPQIRYVKWKFIGEILDEHDAWALGVGIGDGYGLLRKKSVENGLFEGNKARGWHDYAGYNAHNQFFQYLFYIGIIGLIIFSLGLLLSLRTAIINKSILHISLLTVFIFFCMTESVLESQKGIVFFSFFNSLFAFQDTSHDKIANTYN